MTKEMFLNELECRLAVLPKKEVDGYKEFYSEMIDDRVEEGKTEDEAIKDIGGIEEVIKQIAGEKSLTNLVKNKVKQKAPKRRISGLEIFLLVLGFPLWFPLLLTCLILCLVGYLLTWVLVIVTYAVEIALIGSIVAGFLGLVGGNGIGYLGIALAGLGGAIVFFFICILATKISIKLAKKIALGIKMSLIGGGKNNESI